jgi:IS5 family transposase
MSHLLTFADSEFNNKRRKTRKDIFLSRMNELILWDPLEAVIEPIYPKESHGKRPYPLPTILRIHCMQHWHLMVKKRLNGLTYYH